MHVFIYIYIFYHFFSFLSLLFSAILAASYYFTRFCFCLFVCSFLYGLIFFRYMVSLSAIFFIVLHRSGSGERVPSAILTATSNQGPRSLEAAQ